MEAMGKSPLWLAFVATMVTLEALLRLRSGYGYDRRTALASLGLILGGVPFAAFNGLIVAAIYSTIWTLAPLHLPLDDWRTWTTGFFLVELAYYWFHRASHRVRWLWASHSVHHSSEQLTLLSSFRLGWTSLLSAGWLFYAPLVFAGFDPSLVLGLLVFNLRFQTFLHTELIGRLGPLEWIFNTPAHHRLHHACNDAYIDRNYGGVLIIYDRLFGSLATERPDEPIRYGLAHRGPTTNPITIAFREWRIMANEIIAKRGREVGRTLFGTP
jgi:sterol desaturase/sphingolipid hydroxylase (fatty acid hydroxylase superfamily)